jgi:hypothetical protein
MLNTILRYRSAIGQVLALISCTATVICFEYFFGWSWYASIPVGVLAFVTMPTLWDMFIGYLENHQPRF